MLAFEQLEPRELLATVYSPEAEAARILRDALSVPTMPMILTASKLPGTMGEEPVFFKLTPGLWEKALRMPDEGRFIHISRNIRPVDGMPGDNTRILWSEFKDCVLGYKGYWAQRYTWGKMQQCIEYGAMLTDVSDAAMMSYLEETSSQEFDMGYDPNKDLEAMKQILAYNDSWITTRQLDQVMQRVWGKESGVATNCMIKRGLVECRGDGYWYVYFTEGDLVELFPELVP